MSGTFRLQKPPPDFLTRRDSGLGEDAEVAASGGGEETEDSFSSSAPVTVREAILRVLFSPLRRVILLDSE